MNPVPEQAVPPQAADGVVPQEVPEQEAGHEAEEAQVLEMLQHALDLIHEGDAQGAEAVLAEALARFHATEAIEAAGGLEGALAAHEGIDDAVPELQGKLSMASVLPSFFRSIQEEGTKQAGVAAPLVGGVLGAGSAALLQAPSARQDQLLTDTGVITPEEQANRAGGRMVGMGAGALAGAGLGMAAPWAAQQGTHMLQHATQQGASALQQAAKPAVDTALDTIAARFPAPEVVGQRITRGALQETGATLGRSPIGRAWNWLRS